LLVLDYLKYTLSSVVLGIAGYGLWRGGHAAWLGAATPLALLGLDAFLERDYATRDVRFPWLYDAIVVAQLSLSFALVFLYARLVGTGHFATTGGATGAFVSVIVVQFMTGVPALHELFHREQTALRRFGRVGLVLMFDPWRALTHVAAHHLRAATPEDPDYARRGDTLYGYLLRTLRGQVVEAYHLERRAWTKRDRAWWDPRNHWVHAVGLLVGFSLALVAVGGGVGAAAAIATCLLGPRTLVEVFNYVGHYGLISATPGRFENRHTWNHLTPLVRVMALEVTNHADHHADSYKPFYALVPDRDGPQQPHFLVCVLLALVPPLWFRAIKPLLRAWDRQHASPQEREIAQHENVRAGWAELNA
jgi:hypothetical protein